ncbi:MAG: helix-turn-helix transcriptional regulator [Eubacteriales bacterium]
MTLGSRIRCLRLKSKLTQKDIAEKLNMGSSNFGHIENDRVTPSSSDLQKLAGILGTSTDYLLGRIDNFTEGPDTNPDIRMIARSGLSNEQSAELLRLAEALFPNAFKKDSK